MAKVLQADTGKEVASLPIARGPDAVIYDPVRQLAFIPCGGDGVLEIISVADPAHVAIVGHPQTEPRSRTGTLDRQSGRLNSRQPKQTRAGAQGPGGTGR